MKAAITLLLTMIFLAGSLAAWANVGIFPGEAKVPIGPDGAIVAKIKARNEALKQAVYQAITQAVPGRLYQTKKKEITKKILSKAGNYVQSFEVLDASIQDDNYTIKLEARINLERLTVDVKALGGGGDDIEVEGKRILLVTTTRWRDAEDPWDALRDPLRARLEMANLVPLPHPKTEEYLASTAFQRYKERNFDATYDLGPMVDARYALIVRAIIVSQEGAGCPSLGTARMLDLANRKVLAEIPYNFREGVGCEQAAQTGAKTLFALLSQKLQGKGIFDAAPVVATRLMVIGVRNYRDTAELTALLRSIPDLKSIAMHSFSSGGRVTFRITYEGSTDQLKEAVERLSPVGFKLKQRVARDDALLFEVIY